METQLVTDIQKYSIHDGEGIRTTIFFRSPVSGATIRRHRITVNSSCGTGKNARDAGNVQVHVPPELFFGTGKDRLQMQKSAASVILVRNTVCQMPGSFPAGNIQLRIW